jgi:type I restriction enzyme S subunit
MELKPGYKQTEVGVIPEDWDCVRIGDVAETSSGATPARSKQQDYFDGGVIPWVKTLDLNNSLILNSDECVTAKALQVTSLRIYPKESVLVAMYGGFNQIGRTGLLAMDATINQALTAIRPASSKLSSRYLLCYLNFRVEYWKSVASSSRKDPNITGKDVRDFPLPLPPLKEQESIGEALQHIDDYIHSLVALISKKDQLKQAAMQELLTGKRRLPGFEGEWEVKTLFDLANRKKEFFDDGDWIESEHITTEGIRLIQTGNIGVGRFIEKPEKKFINEASFIALRCKQLMQGDLLVCRLADPAGRSCVLPDIGEERIVTSVDVTIFRPPADLADRNFLNQIFSTSYWLSSVSDRSGGTTHKRISRGALGRLSISLPSVAEQSAIAVVLCEMDSELASLEARRDKTRALKQAMMQELLTGRIRLR